MSWQNNWIYLNRALLVYYICHRYLITVISNICINQIWQYQRYYDYYELWKFSISKKFCYQSTSFTETKICQKVRHIRIFQYHCVMKALKVNNWHLKNTFFLFPKHERMKVHKAVFNWFSVRKYCIPNLFIHCQII